MMGWGCAKPHWHITQLIFILNPHSLSDFWKELPIKQKNLRALSSITKLLLTPKVPQLLMPLALLNFVLAGEADGDPCSSHGWSQACRALEKPPELLAAAGTAEELQCLPAKAESCKQPRSCSCTRLCLQQLLCSHHHGNGLGRGGESEKLFTLGAVQLLSSCKRLTEFLHIAVANKIQCKIL